MCSDNNKKNEEESKATGRFLNILYPFSFFLIFVREGLLEKKTGYTMGFFTILGAISFLPVLSHFSWSPALYMLSKIALLAYWIAIGCFVYWLGKRGNFWGKTIIWQWRITGVISLLILLFYITVFVLSQRRYGMMFTVL